MEEKDDGNDEFQTDQSSLTISEKGTLFRRKSGLSAIVLSEGWPSFGLVLQSLGYIVDTFLSHSILDDDLILRKLFTRPPKLMTDFEVNLHNARSNLTLWIQGSKEFMLSLIPLLQNKFKHVVILCPKSGRKPMSIETFNTSFNQGILSHTNLHTSIPILFVKVHQSLVN